jgi:GT2 family glycosyltransferase
MLDTLVRALDAQPQAIWVAPGITDRRAGSRGGAAVRRGGAAGDGARVRRRAFLALGGFDPLFFFYNEDFDASRASARRAASWCERRRHASTTARAVARRAGG